MNLGNLIKTLRTDKGLTQIQLAELLNLKRSTIAGYETNRKQPDIDMLIKIADCFNVSIDYLVGRTSNTNQLLTSNYVNVPDDNLVPLVIDFINRRELQSLVSTLSKLSAAKYNKVINILTILSTETRP